MFHGSLPPQAQSIVYEVISNWKALDIYIGCSGNFTIERCIQPLNKKIHSNDVTIYSCSLGRYLANKPIKLSVKDPDFDWLEEGMSDDIGKISTIMLCTKALEGYGKNNEYYKRIQGAYKNQWPTLLEKTKKKLSSADLKIETFHAGDVAEWVSAIPKEAGFVCFPPFFGGDYEKMNAALDEVFEWEKPQYTLLDDARKQAFFRAATSKDYWLLGTNTRMEDLSDHLCGICQTTNRGMPIFFYASKGPTRRVGPAQKLEPMTIPRLGTSEIGNRMTLIKLSGGHFQTLRSQYMNVGIKPGQPTIAIGVLVDGILIGSYAFSLPNGAINIASKYTPHVYLLSDFPVAPNTYPRLSKLVLYAALSRESKLLAERMLGRRVKSLITTAFSNRPVSMKYRGLFELLNRSETDKNDDDYYAQGFKLNYAQFMGKWTLDEGLKIWKEKHGEHTS